MEQQPQQVMHETGHDEWLEAMEGMAQERARSMTPETGGGRWRALRQKIGSVMFRGRGDVVTYDEYEVPVTEELATVNETNPGEEAIQTAEKQEAKPRSRISSLTLELLSDESIEEEREAALEQFALAEKPDSFDRKAVREYYRLKELTQFNRTGEYSKHMMRADDERFTQLHGMMLDGPKLERGDWLVPPKDSRKTLLIKADDEPMRVPMSNVVYAASFESWQGRGINGTGNKERNHDGASGTSAEAIDMYARLGTAPPPVESVTAFVQPNGLTFYGVDAGAHRAAAALRRGDEYLETEELWVKETGHDYFPLPQEEVDAEEKL